MDPIILIFLIAILVMSVVIHEVSHGYVAEMLGDSTARFAGRLTLNPLNHIDAVSYTHLDVYKRQEWSFGCKTAQWGNIKFF